MLLFACQTNQALTIKGEVKVSAITGFYYGTAHDIRVYLLCASTSRLGRGNCLSLLYHLFYSSGTIGI